MLKIKSIKPLQSYILIKPHEKIGRTSGGILIPDEAKEMTYTADVVAVGPGKYEDGKIVEPKVKVGDKVLHKSYGLTGIKIENEDHFVVEEVNILGIVK